MNGRYLSFVMETIYLCGKISVYDTVGILTRDHGATDTIYCFKRKRAAQG